MCGTGRRNGDAQFVLEDCEIVAARLVLLFLLLCCYFFVYLLAPLLPILRHTRTYTRIMSLCCVKDLKSLEVVCRNTNNSSEIRDIVETIRQGLIGRKTADEVADIRAALIHLCYMTENLKHQADVRACMV